MASLTYPAVDKRPGEKSGEGHAPKRISSAALTYITVLAILSVSGYLAVEYQQTPAFSRPHRVGFAADLAYYDLPRVTVGMGTGDNGPRLRADIALELAKSDMDVMEDFQPRIVDKINGYFATLDPDDLKDAAALATIKKELLRRINTVGAPVPIHDLMFRQMLVM